MMRRVYAEHNVLVVVVLAVSVVVTAYLIGHARGYREGATRAQLTTLAEVKRQCDSPWPLLLNDEFFRCYPLYEYLGDKGAQ